MNSGPTSSLGTPYMNAYNTSSPPMLYHGMSNSSTTTPVQPSYYSPTPISVSVSVRETNNSLHNIAHLIRDSNNIVIKFLPNHFTQDNLYNMCIVFGNILSCRLIRDRHSGISLGYGFVTFESDSSAVVAVNTLNGLPIENKILRCSIAKPITVNQIHNINNQNNNSNNKSHHINKQNLYVAGLPRHYTVLQLNELFHRYGNIIESRILTDRTGVSRGLGFVRYDDIEAAQLAIDNLNQVQLDNNDDVLTVRYARDNNNIQQQNNNNQNQQFDNPILQNNNNNNLYNNATSINYMDGSNPQYKQQTQPIFTFHQNNNIDNNNQNNPSSLDIPNQNNNNNMLHNRMISAQSSPTSLLARQVALNATATPGQTPSHKLLLQQQQQQQQQHNNIYNTQSIQNINNNNIPNYNLPSFTNNSTDGINNNNNNNNNNQNGSNNSLYDTSRRSSYDRFGFSLFVFHLPADYTDQELYNLFNQAGHVLSAKVMYNADINQSKGYGFVNYATLNDAQNAITQFNGKQINGKFLKVNFKEKKQQQLFLQQQQQQQQLQLNQQQNL